MIRLLLVMVSLALAGCGNPTFIDGKQYATACQVPADCAAVFFGDQCSACACPNAAISASQKVTYDADRSGARAACGPQPAIACAECPEVVLTCTSGVCGVQPK